MPGGAGLLSFAWKPSGGVFLGSGMWAYVLKRLLLMVPLLVGITLVSFVVIHLAPGTPVELQTTMNPQVSL